MGYYKDPEKSAKTFITIDGVRYSIPGDYARIEEGNRLTLLGRGSNCVNTGGEKVYPEEVEQAIKAHPAVYDALVIGLPDKSSPSKACGSSFATACRVTSCPVHSRSWLRSRATQPARRSTRRPKKWPLLSGRRSDAYRTL